MIESMAAVILVIAGVAAFLASEYARDLERVDEELAELELSEPAL